MLGLNQDGVEEGEQPRAFFGAATLEVRVKSRAGAAFTTSGPIVRRVSGIFQSSYLSCIPPISS